jgi:hypothetical protein
MPRPKVAPSYSRKDYKFVAGILSEAPVDLPEAFADRFAADNPRFDRERFLAACRPGRLDGWIAQARQLGVAHAQTAAEWSFDGRSDRAERARVLAMLRDGDPAAFDHLPAQPNLSGEFADDLTPGSLYEQIVGGDVPATPELLDELAASYELGVAETFSDACEAALIEYVGDDT